MLNEFVYDQYTTVRLAKITNQDFNEAIKNITSISDFPRLTYKNNKLAFICDDNSYFRFNGNIAHILKITETKLTKKTLPIYIHTNVLNLVQTIYVYTDIVEYQFVGDSMSPLLRTVTTSDKDFDSVVHAHFDSPHYISVNKTLITSINIDIRDDQGEKIHFEQGKTLVKLHFRPKRYGF